MSNRHLIIAAAALLVPIALAGKWSTNHFGLNAYGEQSGGACGYYTNSSGHEVPRPCGDWRTNQGVTPAGATALCGDGTYSYSEHPHARGTCSYHGGAVKYLR
jgi:hypothetical protein